MSSLDSRPAQHSKTTLASKLSQLACVVPYDAHSLMVTRAQVLPLLLKSAVMSSHTLIFVPSYYDFVRLRAHMRGLTDFEFAAISEFVPSLLPRAYPLTRRPGTRSTRTSLVLGPFSRVAESRSSLSLSAFTSSDGARVRLLDCWAPASGPAQVSPSGRQDRRLLRLARSRRLLLGANQSSLRWRRKRHQRNYRACPLFASRRPQAWAHTRH